MTKKQAAGLYSSYRFSPLDKLITVAAIVTALAHRASETAAKSPSYFAT
jgi:hypothetical protein